VRGEKEKMCVTRIPEENDDALQLCGGTDFSAAFSFFEKSANKTRRASELSQTDIK
jgi:hypothetical protein